MRDLATELIEQQEKLATERSTYDSHCQEVAEIMFPGQNDFFRQEKMDGEKRTDKIVDGTAQLDLERFAGIIEFLLTPRSSKWHGLKSPHDEVNDDQSASEWYDKVRDKLFQIRYSPKANFASQQQENYKSLGAFGGAVKIIEEMPGRGIRYKSSHIAEHFYMENAHGLVDANWRRYRLTARQAAQKFQNHLNDLPQVIKDAIEKNPSKKFEFLHCVFPNQERQYGMTGSAHYPFASFHVAVEGKKLLGKQGGFRTFPFIISRYSTAPNEVHGRSVGMIALAEAKMLNQQRKTDLRARHMAVDPVILAADQQTVRAIRMVPRKINYGALDAQGNPLVKPFDNRARIELSNDAIEQSRSFIHDTFLVSVFRTMIENPQMTATQVLEVVRERDILVSPAGGRLETEDLGPMIEREIDILAAHGAFDEGGELEMPAIIRETGGAFEIEYTSPLARMRKSEEALGAQRTIEAALPYAEFSDVMDNFNLDEYVDIIGSAHGAPSRLFLADEEKEALRKQRAQQKAMETTVAAAPSVAGSIKDIADAQAALNA